MAIFVLITLVFFYSPIKNTLDVFDSPIKITGRVLEGQCSDYSAETCPKPECAAITRAVQGCTGVTNTEVCVLVEEACEELEKTGVCFTPLCKLEKKY